MVRLGSQPMKLSNNSCPWVKDSTGYLGSKQPDHHRSSKKDSLLQVIDEKEVPKTHGR